MSAGARGEGIRPLRFEPGCLWLLDQRKLPASVEWLRFENASSVSAAIRDMVVRGAPAIGIAAAYGMALEARRLAAAGTPLARFKDGLEHAADVLIRARPTAVNLSWAVRRVLAVATRAWQEGADVPAVAAAVEREAVLVHEEDVEMNRRIGEAGSALVPDGGGVLTHCNAGALATGGYGTALGVLRAARQKGRRFLVYVDETRPVLQGARLTAWELLADGFDVVLLVDSAAGYLMGLGKINAVVVGADRIAANGDVVNKVGTYALAVLAKEHGVPFYVAAPSSTFDLGTPRGSQIVIEERPAEEVTTVGGVRVAADGVGVVNPAFDVTPCRYVTGIITERGILYPPYESSIAKTFGSDPG